MTENMRYRIFRKLNGRCHHCGTRLRWEFFEVRGRSGGWVLNAEDSAGPDGSALCYRCHELPDRKGGKVLVATES